jgi:serine/threonine protein kinase
VWLVLEHCGGGELYEYLLKRHRLTEQETQKIFAQICGAVAYIHSRGIVHRDLKLENIFLDRKNNIKLGDFGFVRENDKSLMKTWCGSTAYSAPEILQRAKYSGEAVDVWSLGIILFALLSGQLPYDEEDELATKRMILECQPVCPPFFSDEVTQLINMMLNKDPDQRPSALEILQHPFLRDFAPEQLNHLANPYEPTFMTRMEKTILERMSVGGIDTQKIMSSVLDYSCDSLCGWWWLSLKRERRRERKARHQRQFSNDEDLRDIRARSRSRPRSVDGRRASYRFPGESSSSLRLQQDTSGKTRMSPKVASSPVADTTAPALYSQFKSPARIDERETKLEDQAGSGGDASLKLTPKATQTTPQSHDAANRKELGLRKQSVLATLKDWWADHAGRTNRHRSKSLGKSSKSSTQPPSPKGSHEKRTLPNHVAPPFMRPRSRSRDSRGSSVTFVRQPRRPGMPRRISSSSSVTSRRLSYLTSQDSIRQANLRSPSPNMASGSHYRPEIARTISASSAQSSVASYGHGPVGFRGHSKASSTSSNSTFASARSMRSPRNPLKVMPSTPPPYLIQHGRKEPNVFESSMSGTGAVQFATRKKRSALMHPQQSTLRGKDKASIARRPMTMSKADLIEEEDEEEDEEDAEESEFVDE